MTAMPQTAMSQTAMSQEALRGSQAPQPFHVTEPRPSPAALKAAMRELLPAFRKRAAAAEKTRQVPAENLSALRDAGLYKIVQPRRFGGYEYDFDVLVDLMIDASRACASTGWVYGLFAAHQWLVASFLPTRSAIFGMKIRTLPSAAPTRRPEKQSPSKAVIRSVDAGRSPAAATTRNGRYVLPFCRREQKAMPSAPAFLLVPAADYSIDDTWNVVGLAGTGSKTLVLNDVFVPEHRVLTFAETTSGRTPGAALHR